MKASLSNVLLLKIRLLDHKYDCNLKTVGGNRQMVILLCVNQQTGQDIFSTYRFLCSFVRSFPVWNMHDAHQGILFILLILARDVVRS